jgi:hypothetical protein
MFAEKGTALFPDAISCLGVTLPKAFVDPHSNQTVVTAPSGFTVASRVAPSPIKPVAGCVTTAGFETVAELKLTLNVMLQFPGIM